MTNTYWGTWGSYGILRNHEKCHEKSRDILHHRYHTPSHFIFYGDLEFFVVGNSIHHTYLSRAPHLMPAKCHFVTFFHGYAGEVVFQWVGDNNSGRSSENEL